MLLLDYYSPKVSQKHCHRGIVLKTAAFAAILYIWDRFLWTINYQGRGAEEYSPKMQWSDFGLLLLP